MSINDTKKPKKGRPPVDSEPVNLRLPRALIAAVDDHRRIQPDIPTRPEAIRQLIHTGLAARPILRDLLRLIEHLPTDPEMERHATTIREALGE